MRPTNRRWRVLGIRLSGNDMERVEAAAEEAGETVSTWAKDAVLTKLDPPINILDILPSPREELDVVTCPECHHSRQIRRRPQFNAPSLPSLPEDDPGCQNRECIAAAEARRRGLTPQETLETCLTVGTGFMAKPIPAPETLNGGDMAAKEAITPETPFVIMQRNMTLKEFAQLYPPVTSTPMVPYEPDIGLPMSLMSEYDSSRDVMLPRPKEAASWAQEFSFMDAMDPANAMDHFKELIAGRKLPKGFTGWPRPQQVAWLDKEMPL